MYCMFLLWEPALLHVALPHCGCAMSNQKHTNTIQTSEQQQQQCMQKALRHFRLMPHFHHSTWLLQWHVERWRQQVCEWIETMCLCVFVFLAMWIFIRREDRKRNIDAYKNQTTRMHTQICHTFGADSKALLYVYLCSMQQIRMRIRHCTKQFMSNKSKTESQSKKFPTPWVHGLV